MLPRGPLFRGLVDSGLRPSRPLEVMSKDDPSVTRIVSGALPLTAPWPRTARPWGIEGTPQVSMTVIGESDVRVSRSAKSAGAWKPSVFKKALVFCTLPTNVQTGSAQVDTANGMPQESLIPLMWGYGLGSWASTYAIPAADSASTGAPAGSGVRTHASALKSCASAGGVAFTSARPTRMARQPAISRLARRASHLRLVMGSSRTDDWRVEVIGRTLVAGLLGVQARRHLPVMC